jgi:hypothetical protein
MCPKDDDEDYANLPINDKGKFYKKKEFKDLQKEWYDKLKPDFKDIEDSKGNLKQHDRRTIAFDNRDKLQDFFNKLDTYLTQNDDIPDKDREILELYTQGIHIKGPQGIIELTGWSDATIRKLIRRYKSMLLKE